MSAQRDGSVPAAKGFPAVVLAAGKGTRMKTAEPKAAVHVNGRPMVARVIAAIREAGSSRVIAVVGHRASDVRAAIGDQAECVVQEQQAGTGHAVRCAAGVLESYHGPIVVAYSDIPLLCGRHIQALVQRHLQAQASATLLTAKFREPGTLGRIVRGPDGSVKAIVEARDATPDQLKIREINVGAYCFHSPLVFEVLAQVTSNNAQKQYYLTDVIGILVARGKRVEAVTMDVALAGMGVDTVEDLARVETISGASEYAG